MPTTDAIFLLDNAPTLKPGDTDLAKSTPRIEHLTDLYRRFRQELENSTLRSWNLPTPPRSKVLDSLSFSELFHLTALWHDVERPRLRDGADAQQGRRWQGFYSWMEDYLQERWVRQFGLVEAGGALSYRRLQGKHAKKRYFITAADYPPCCDHTTLWRRKGTPPRFAEVLVTQPYGYDLDKMVAFAKTQGLWFWISERPAWHYPGGVFFIEWAKPESQFASLRGTQEADAAMRTIHTWKGEDILPGPGTVFTLAHPVTITHWRDGHDANSLMYAELTRMTQLHDEGPRA